MSIFGDINLLIVGLTVAAIAILGFIVYLNNPKSITNRTFLLFALISIVYSITNLASSMVRSTELMLWLMRLVIFSATIYSYIFFRFFYVFPRQTVVFPKLYRYFVTPVVISVAILTLTPFVFSGIAELPPIGQVPTTEVEAGILVFVLLSLSLVIGGFYLLIKKTRRASSLERIQYRFILIGTVVTFTLILIFNLILPAIFLNVRFILLAPVFTIPFIALTAYAIIKYRFLDIRVIATQLFIFALWLILLFRLLAAESLGERMLDGLILAATTVLGLFLVKSVLREVETREKMVDMAVKLEVANDELKRLDVAKSDFISIASHQLRTPLSIIKGYISMMREGTFGNFSDKLRKPLEKVFISNERLINLVADLLDLSRMERGKMQYDFQQMHLLDAVGTMIADFSIVAHNKGIKFSWNKRKIDDLVYGDPNKIRQIVLNIIDNAIKYTPPGGSIAVSAEHEDHKISLVVKDTGPGLTKEEIEGLFNKFIRGRQERKSHTEGLGLGLYVAKLIAEAHDGTLTAASAGKGRGSTFTLTLPLSKKSLKKS